MCDGCTADCDGYLSNAVGLLKRLQRTANLAADFTQVSSWDLLAGAADSGGAGLERLDQVCRSGCACCAAFRQAHSGV